MKTTFSRFLLMALFALASSAALADTMPITGIPPLSTIAGGPFDSVNLANLNVHFSIPIFSRAGIGRPFTYSLTYDSLIWTNLGGVWEALGAGNWGWAPEGTANTGHLQFSKKTLGNCGYHDVEYQFGPFTYIDSNGTSHQYQKTLYWDNLGYCDEQLDFTELANDGSGLTLHASTDETKVTATVTASNGTVFTPSQNGINGKVVDVNGNTITSGTDGTITDTLGSVALTIVGSAPVYPNCSNTVKYQYSAPGGTATVTVSYVPKTVQTNFNVIANGQRIVDWSTPVSECLVDHITLSDQTVYSFTYELTNGSGSNVTGRIKSVTLPTGGVITYSYAGTGCGNNSNCMMADGSPSHMSKTLSGGPYIGAGPWTYTRTIQSGQQLPQTSLKIVDPASNETDLKFSGIYETERNVYQGAASPNNILDYSYICYNGNWSDDSQCPAASVTPPIQRLSRNDHMNVISTTSYYSGMQQWFDTYYQPSSGVGNLVHEYDYSYAPHGGTHPLLRQENIVYNTSLCTGTYTICDRPASVQVTDGTNQKSYTGYTYDEGGNTHGLPTSVSQWVATGKSNLVQHYSYDSHGVLQTATDPRGELTDYHSGGYSCNGAFPNSVKVAGLETDYLYNCTGSVVTQVTEVNLPNNTTTNTVYTESYYWRPKYTTDALGNRTYYNYYNVSNNPGGSHVTTPGQTESVLSWTGSTADALITPDIYGRPWLQQRLNPQSMWDTVQDFHDVSGRVVFVSFPFASSYAGPSAASSGSIPATGYLYDNLGRTTYTETCNGVHCNGPNTAYIYNLDDVKVVNCNSTDCTSGHPGTFSKELEYDALGQVTSVCELTSAHDQIPCGQQTTNNGYPTVYGYDALSDLTHVAQGAQNRSYSYDGLGRMTSETNPESGTKSYTFDSVGTGYCPAGAYSSPGDLVETTDANGNNICYYYDGLHRLTDVGNNRYSATNPCHRFRYDNSTGSPSGINPVNVMGHLVEAETDDCSHHALTDEWFSYTARGGKTDVWQSSPNSGGWYHVQESYFPNGAMMQLQGFTGTGTSTPFSDPFVYSLDAEGRPYSMSHYGSNVWSSTDYNAANQPKRVVQGAGGEEDFTYGGSQGGAYGNAMQSWQSTAQSTAGSSQQSGTLTWNGNGTLYQLAITDTVLHSADAQFCTNTYDDLARLIGNACGSWSQNFSYDRYGNITISGSNPFPASYNAATNRVNNLGFIYDANGNITSDNAHPFAYDVYERPVSVGAATTVFDASDRAVELHNASGYTQFVYTPNGTKFAYMSGQTLQKYMMPMAAGMQAVHVHASPSDYGYFVHTDWLGSSRLAVNPDGTVRYDRAYAPFGQAYAELNGDNTNRSFTGQNEDTTPGIYDFPLRQQSQNEGRWFTPDPAGIDAVNISNPQTWNRYAYVGNNPLSNVDPQGLCGNNGHPNMEQLAKGGIEIALGVVLACSPASATPFGFLGAVTLISAGVFNIEGAYDVQGASEMAKTIECAGNIGCVTAQGVGVENEQLQDAATLVGDALTLGMSGEEPTTLDDLSTGLDIGGSAENLKNEIQDIFDGNIGNIIYQMDTSTSPPLDNEGFQAAPPSFFDIPLIYNYNADGNNDIKAGEGCEGGGDCPPDPYY